MQLLLQQAKIDPYTLHTKTNQAIATTMPKQGLQDKNKKNKAHIWNINMTSKFQY